MSQRPRLSKLLWKLVFRLLPGLFLLLAGGPEVFGQATWTAYTNTNAGTCGNTNDTLTIKIIGHPGNYTVTINGPDPSTSPTPLVFTMTVPASPDSVQKNLTNLALGNYNVAVTDGSSSQTLFPSLSSIPGPNNAYLNAVTDASCLNNDGVVDIIVLGGTPNYTFMYNGTSVGTSTTTTGEATGLPSGSLILTVVDGNGCVLPAGVYVPINDNLTLLMDNSAQICEGT